MSLREAYYYLRSRRPIIGPNFGFIKQVIIQSTSISISTFSLFQLIAYEKSLFGTTSVSFIDTSFGSVPDIYLSREETRRPITKTIPIEITKRPKSYIERSTTTDPSSRMISNNDYPPITSFMKNSSFLRDQPRFNSTAYKPFDSLREPFLSTRLNALRTGKYAPSFFNRYYLP